MLQQSLLFGVLTLVTVVGQAASPEDIVKYRQNVMSANGGLIGACNALIQNKIAFKGQLVGYARALETLSQGLPALFPEGSNTAGDTEALAGVWSKRAEFERLAEDARVKAAAFARAAEANDPQLAERYKALADACKSCHKDFRK